jgi:hypothetical protein
MKHHLVSEDKLREQCFYCGNNIILSDFESEHIHGIHYKSLDCRCGKKLHFKVSWEGSGHDRISMKQDKSKRQNIVTLEQKVKPVKF